MNTFLWALQDEKDETDRLLMHARKYFPPAFVALFGEAYGAKVGEERGGQGGGAGGGGLPLN